MDLKENPDPDPLISTYTHHLLIHTWIPIVMITMDELNSALATYNRPIILANNKGASARRSTHDFWSQETKVKV
jgi:hypothetical protein